jgi:glycosyltransferase involved in cell wall biosynthesis
MMQTGEREKKLRPIALLRAAIGLPGLALRLSRLLSRIHPRVVVTNGMKAHLLGALAQVARQRPLVWYFREGLEGRPLSTALLRGFSSACDAVVAISHYTAGEARRVVPPKVPVHVVYNIVDLARFHPGGIPPRDLPKPTGEIWFGMIGALTPLKGQDLFLDAAEAVARAIPEARFVLAGANFYKTEGAGFERQLRDRAGSDALCGRVLFLGARNDIPAILSALDVLVQPNRGPEGLGRSVLEAMACGVPVVAVDRWGPAELIRHGQTGLLSRWMDVEHLAENMKLLALRPDLRSEIGANARAWMAASFAPTTLADRFVSALERTISN